MSLTHRKDINDLSETYRGQDRDMLSRGCQNLRELLMAVIFVSEASLMHENTRGEIYISKNNAFCACSE